MTAASLDLEGLAQSCLQSAKIVMAYLATNGSGKFGPQQPDLETLAQSCLQSALTIKASLAPDTTPRIGFDALAAPAFPKLDETAERARSDLKNAAREMYDLATGPQECLMESSLTSLQYTNSMRYICHFKIPDFVPDVGEIDYDSLAKLCGADMAQLKQYLRFAMTNRIFCEPNPGTVAHTIGSVLLKEGKPTQPLVQWLTEDCAPMIAHQIDAIEKWGHGSQEPNQTAVNYAYGGQGDFYEFIAADPIRERRFGITIQQASQQPASSLKHIQSGFNWLSLGKATVVDVGGHVGFGAVAIAQAASDLQVIVQDRPEVVAMALDPKTTVVPADLRDRVSFEAHDFFKAQKTSADVYFYRKTLLNYTDKYAARIIGALAPVLQSGNRLLIMDFVQEERAIQATAAERKYRAVDLQMLLYYNCRYRTLEEWKNLVSTSVPRLEFEAMNLPTGSSMPIMSFIVR